MKSQKQADANRRNALRSSGPKTEAGKRRSAVSANGGQCAGITTDYWVDLRDLLVYGDQQINFALS